MSTFNENGFSIKEQILAIVAGLLIVAIVGWFLPINSGFNPISGSSGAQYVEDYSPLVSQAGFNTLKDATFGGTLSVTGATTFTGVSTHTGDVTFNGGNGALVVTSTNTATSSIAVGCVEMAATSTATKVRLLFSIASTTLTTSGLTSNGLMAWGYGTCPI